MPKSAVQSGRRSPRLHHDLPVVHRSPSGSLSDWATDISRGGIFINTRSPLPVGTSVQVTVQIPGARFPCVLRGRVTHVEECSPDGAHDPGMGIEFTDVGHDDGEQIETFVEMMRPTLDRA